jgi:hypothetical protein
MMDDFTKIKPGKPGIIDVKTGWTLENEIEWTENYTSNLEHTLHYQYDRLDKMYKQKAWWCRFIRYCRTGK